MSTDRPVYALLLVGAALVSLALGALMSSTGHVAEGLAVGAGLFAVTGAFPLIQLLRRTRHQSPSVRGTSAPVPWIADAVWASATTTAVLPAGETSFISPAPGALTVAPAGAQVPAMSADALRDALARTPDVLSPFRNETPWGRCCDRLMVLVLASPDAQQLGEWERRVSAPLDALLPDPWPTELAAIRAGQSEQNGVHVFHCSACGQLAGGLLHA